MVLACQNISKAYGITEILNNINFHIETKEKLAIVGINGAGKSTLLKIIMQEEEADEGQVVIGKDITVGYLAQHQNSYFDKTIYEELLSVKQDVITLQEDIRKLELDMKHLSGSELDAALERYTRMMHTFEQQDGYAFESQVTGILKGLGFSESDFNRPVSELSGGQKTRVSLGRLLLSRPDVILLDEPTNHLDLNSIGWLETYLSNYDGAVIIVSHDRYFLDKIVTKVVEIENTKSTIYHGNYSYYASKREEVRLSKYRAYMNQQAEIKHQEEVIAKLKQFNREKSIKRAESREKMLNKMEQIEKPVTQDTQMKLTLEPNILSGTDVLSVSGLTKSFDGTCLFKNIDFDIKRGERIALIGNNGTGKTTILKIINGLIGADSGEVKPGANVHIGYYDQEHHVLHMDKTIFEEISDTYPNMNNTQIRNVLAAFLFTGDDVFKKISDLSGGERGRVSLAKLMLSEANFLILDEPTNHLDITSKEILENALNSYTGTVLYVSHDRYFINKTATRILHLTQNQIVNYVGNYDYFLEKKDILSPTESVVATTSTATASNSDGKLDWKKQKEEQANKRKKENELKRLEEQIAELEGKIAQLDELMTTEEVFSNVQKCLEVSNEKNELVAKLEEAYEKWEVLAE